MAENSKIEWTDATWNPITGCTIKSPGCNHCYAMKLAGTRLRNHPSRHGLTQLTKTGYVWNGVVRLNEDWLLQPLEWRKPRMIFVCAHGDLFHENVPDEWIDKVFAVMALSPHHTFQVLTKRAERMRAYMSVCKDSKIQHLYAAAKTLNRFVDAPGDGCYLPDRLAGWPLPNVWLGVSAERQQEADERIPHLLEMPSAVRFLSAEPLLGAVDLKRWVPAGSWGKFHGAPVFNSKYFLTKCERCGWFGSSELCGEMSYGDDADVVCPSCNEIFNCDEVGASVDWVIVGGESGQNARMMEPEWAASLKQQCKQANVAFFMKQMTGKKPIPADLMIRQFPSVEGQ